MPWSPGCPAELRRIWRLLVIELVYGQRRDLTGSAAGRHDLAHAREVARLKSGAYTVERPLQLGAAAARAPEVVSAALATYGREIGEAFALRDDLLGVWGDPARTGKPAGDDLISAKPTVILALAHERATGPARQTLGKVGTPTLTCDDIAQLQESLQDWGVVGEVEERIRPARRRRVGRPRQLRARPRRGPRADRDGPQDRLAGRMSPFDRVRTRTCYQRNETCVRVVVIGAGLAGLAAACHLTGRGYEVTVVEREDIPGGRNGSWCGTASPSTPARRC